jgi:hypothetical protein
LSEHYQNIVELFEEKEASRHALTTGDGITFTGGTSNKLKK